MATLFRPPKDAGRRPNNTAGRLQGDSTFTFAWEDAIDLYQGFEWQESARSFLGLSQSISHEKTKTQCLLNAAIVYARSGNYHEAADVLDEISPPDAFLALTLFLMGHVQYELHETDRAEQCFRIALDQLNGKSVKFDDLDFVLDPSQLKLNLAMMDKIMKSSGGTGGHTALPADGILKVASRPSLSDSAFLRNSKTPTDRTSTITALRTSCAPAPAPAKETLNSLGAQIESIEYSQGDVKRHNTGQQSIACDSAPEPTSFLSRRSIGSIVRRMSYRRQPKQPKSADNCTPPPMLYRTAYMGGFAQGGFDPEPEHDQRSLPRLQTQQYAPPMRSATRPLSFADLSDSPIRSLSASDSPARSSVSDSPPSLTDRESISDVSTHSDFGPASADLMEVGVQTDGESVDQDSCVLPPPKNPSRRIVAMERAQKILAERARIAPTQPSGSHQSPPIHAEHVAFTGQPRLSIELSASPTLASRDTTVVSDNDYLYPRAPPPIPRKRSQHASPTKVSQQNTLTALPAMPDAPHRVRPDVTRRLSAFLTPVMPSLAELIEPSH